MARKRTQPVEENAAVVQLPTKKQGRERTPDATVQRIIELRKERKGLPTIAKTLNEEGIKTATGKEWRPQTVRMILIRHDAMGEPVINRQPKQVEEPVAEAAAAERPTRRRTKQSDR